MKNLKRNESMVDKFQDWERQQKILNNEEIELTRDEMIRHIKNIVQQNEGSIGMGELEADHSPIHTDSPGVVDLIEYLKPDGVEVHRWRTNNDQDPFAEYNISYEEVSDENISYIVDLIDNALEYDLIEGL